MSRNSKKLTKDSIGDRIRDARESKGMLQQDLADKMGIKREKLSYLETGQRQPSVLDITFLANYFGISTDYLLGLYENQTLATASIGNETGLSDKAIFILQECKKNNYKFLKTFNALVEQISLKFVNFLARDDINMSEFEIGDYFSVIELLDAYLSFNPDKDDFFIFDEDDIVLKSVFNEVNNNNQKGVVKLCGASIPMKDYFQTVFMMNIIERIKALKK